VATQPKGQFPVYIPPADAKPYLDPLNNVLVAVVSFNTLQLTKNCITSLRAYYPNIYVAVVDNGSTDGSREYVLTLKDTEKYAVVVNDENYGHGVGLVQAISIRPTEFFFTLHSDCEFREGGLLEFMLGRMRDNTALYAIGPVVPVRRSNCTAIEDFKGTYDATMFPYVRPYAALFRRSMYEALAPIITNGAPFFANLVDAYCHHMALEDCPVDNYVFHHAGGTRRMYLGEWWLPSADEARQAWDLSRTPRVF